MQTNLMQCAVYGLSTDRLTRAVKLAEKVNLNFILI